MDLHELKPKTSRKHHQRIGRGGKRGTTSGRGTKGQKSRSGHKIRPAIRDLMMKIPKRRGFNFKSFTKAYAVLNLSDIEKNFNAGEKVTPKTLAAKGLVDVHRGALPKIKILGKGALTKKLIFENLSVSQDIASKVIALGGELRILPKK